MSIVLKGITWDHPRGYAPLAHSAQMFRNQNPEVEIQWERRSLTRFGAEPIEQLAERYDLLVIDHPFCGQAQQSGCLLDLSKLLEPAFIEQLRADSVGPATDCYAYDGKRWALPTDVAAQVACYRPDLLKRLEQPVPRGFGEVVDLGQRARKRGCFIGLPLSPTDTGCSFLTLLANLDEPLSEHADLNADAACAALEILRELFALGHPACLEWNPIRAYDHMTQNQDLVYMPFAFGYSNYARDQQNLLRFADIAGPGKDPTRGALLGGAGCALGHRCRDVDAAGRYLEFLHAAEHQAGDYFEHGGQPGRLSAWRAEGTNAQCGNFFINTLTTLKHSHVRPRFAGFVPFLEHSGASIRRFLLEGGSVRSVVDRLRTSYARSRRAA